MDITAIQKEAQKKLQVFGCYAHKDRPLLQELEKHLKSLQRDGLITFWVDTDVHPGTEWEKEIHRQAQVEQFSPGRMDSLMTL